MKKIIVKITFILIVTFFSIDFISAQDYSFLPNVSSIYTPSSSYLHPRYKLFITEENKAEVYIKMNIEELNFIQLANKDYQSKLRIKYIFYKSLENTAIIDSASNSYTLKERTTNKSLVTKFDIDIPEEHCYLVIITQDLYNRKKSLNFLSVNDSSLSSSKFLLIDSITNFPIFTNYLKPYKTYYFKTSFSNKSYLVQKFFTDTLFPTPPYSTNKNKTEIKIDTQFNINSNSYFKFKKAGIYKIINTDTKEFTYISNFSNYFPNIYTPPEMVYPLRYFASTSEYIELEKTINKKLAIDNFWLSKNSDPQKARALIKIYYNRAMLSNLFFTSTKEGWKTDRGMIYIIFGPPAILHKGDNVEEWIYSNSFNGRKKIFIFNKTVDKNNFDDFVLSRNSSYAYEWKNAIEMWNKGNIYSF